MTRNTPISRLLQCPLFYYRTPAGVEVDFIIETGRRRPGSPSRVAAIEVKRAERWDRAWDKPLRRYLFINDGLVTIGLEILDHEAANFGLP